MGQAHTVKLRYTLPALADLDAILDYIATRSPYAAGRIQERIRALIDLLYSILSWVSALTILPSAA